MNKLALVAATALAVASFGTAAVYAQDATGGKFADVDANKDNVVSLTEAQSAYPTLNQTLFDQADQNHDGNLDETEFGSLQSLVAAGMAGGGGDGNAASASGAGDNGGASSSQQ